ncbi:MAG: hypothetical protein OXN21_07040 [Chloroflexota bacterium]|nr:hypothetical protein [Chloroflexota bacterium]
MDLLDALVEERGRVPAAQALGVNYRTLALCCDSREVSRRMRRALVEFRDRGGAGGGETGDGDGGGPPDGDPAVLRERVAELEEENAELRELADNRARQLELLTRRLAALEDSRQSGDAAEVVGVDADADDAHGHDRTDGVDQDWRPPRRRPGMPDAGVVTLEEQPDEEHAFGPAAALVAEWRRLRTAGAQNVSRVDRAQATVRRWELEAAMIGEYHLTLPPDTYPLDGARRADYVRWRRDALAEARRELGKAKRKRLLRRVITLGLWRS